MRGHCDQLDRPSSCIRPEPSNDEMSSPRTHARGTPVPAPPRTRARAFPGRQLLAAYRDASLSASCNPVSSPVTTPTPRCGVMTRSVQPNDAMTWPSRSTLLSSALTTVVPTAITRPLPPSPPAPSLPSLPALRTTPRTVSRAIRDSPRRYAGRARQPNPAVPQTGQHRTGEGPPRGRHLRATPRSAHRPSGRR